MVATDIAARGIDVLSISHVINYDMPDTPEAYTHRIGRTGRAEQTGEAYTMVTSEDDADVRAVEKLLGQRIERRTLAGFDYTARPANADEFARGPRPPRPQPKQRTVQPFAQPSAQGGAGKTTPPSAPQWRPDSQGGRRSNGTPQNTRRQGSNSPMQPAPASRSR
jgi:superfamily II DNA/RNA helicase